MTTLNIILFMAIIYMELSSKINTDNLIKKVAMGIIASGALTNHYFLLQVGITVYLVVDVYKAYRHKRAGDFR